MDSAPPSSCSPARAAHPQHHHLSVSTSLGFLRRGSSPSTSSSPSSLAFPRQGSSPFQQRIQLLQCTEQEVIKSHIQRLQFTHSFPAITFCVFRTSLPTAAPGFCPGSVPVLPARAKGHRSGSRARSFITRLPGIPNPFPQSQH